MAQWRGTTSLGTRPRLASIRPARHVRSRAPPRRARRDAPRAPPSRRVARGVPPAAARGFRRDRARIARRDASRPRRVLLPSSSAVAHARVSRALHRRGRRLEPRRPPPALLLILLLLLLLPLVGRRRRVPRRLAPRLGRRHRALRRRGCQIARRPRRGGGSRRGDRHPRPRARAPRSGPSASCSSCSATPRAASSWRRARSGATAESASEGRARREDVGGERGETPRRAPLPRNSAPRSRRGTSSWSTKRRFKFETSRGTA